MVVVFPSLLYSRQCYQILIPVLRIPIIRGGGLNCILHINPPRSDIYCEAVTAFLAVRPEPDQKQAAWLRLKCRGSVDQNHLFRIDWRFEARPILAGSGI